MTNPLNAVPDFWAAPNPWPTSIELPWRHEGERRQGAWDWCRLAVELWNRAPEVRPFKDATSAFKTWRNGVAARTQHPPRRDWGLAEMDRLADELDRVRAEAAQDRRLFAGEREIGLLLMDKIERERDDVWRSYNAALDQLKEQREANAAISAQRDEAWATIEDRDRLLHIERTARGDAEAQAAKEKATWEIMRDERDDFSNRMTDAEAKLAESLAATGKYVAEMTELANREDSPEAQGEAVRRLFFNRMLGLAHSEPSLDFDDVKAFFKWEAEHIGPTFCDPCIPLFHGQDPQTHRLCLRCRKWFCGQHLATHPCSTTPESP